MYQGILHMSQVTLHVSSDGNRFCLQTKGIVLHSTYSTEDMMILNSRAYGCITSWGRGSKLSFSIAEKRTSAPPPATLTVFLKISDTHDSCGMSTITIPIVL